MRRIRISFEQSCFIVGIILIFQQIKPVAAQNTVMEVDGDQTVNKTATVNENLKVNTSSSPGSPGFISGSNGDAYIKDQLEVDGDVSVDGSTFRINATYNSVGIGTTAAYSEKLTLNGGGFSIYEQASHPFDEIDNAKFYAKEVSGEAKMFAMDGSGDYVQLSSHIPPSLFDSSLHSSYEDPSVIIPFSYHHGNKYIGKGAVVDLAGLVSEAEKRFGKSFTTIYNLPVEETETVIHRQARLELHAKERILTETPEVEIPIQDAWENAEIMDQVERTYSTTRYRYDLTTENVIPFQVEEKVTELTGTGRYERRLKDRVRFDETTGKFFRQRSIDEIQLSNNAVPPLPTWILSRIKK